MNSSSSNSSSDSEEFKKKTESQDYFEFTDFDEDENEDTTIDEEDEEDEEFNLHDRLEEIKHKPCKVVCRVDETVKIADDKLIVCKGLIVAKKALVKCTRWKKIEKDGKKTWEREK